MLLISWCVRHVGGSILNTCYDTEDLEDGLITNIRGRNRDMLVYDHVTPCKERKLGSLPFGKQIQRLIRDSKV
jgi:hypothetical protein